MGIPGSTLIMSNIRYPNFGHLSDFTKYLYEKKEQNFKYIYIPAQNNFIQTLTLKDNIILNNPFMLSGKHGYSLSNYLGQTNNYYLLELFSKINMITELPKMTDLQSLKVASMLSCFIRKTDYIFVNQPDQHLSMNCLNLFIKAISLHLKNSSTKIIISSNDINIWKRHCLNHVSIGELKIETKLILTKTAI